MSKHANNPIGIFDSGLGGLTVLKQLQRTLPHEDFVYFGDTARVPYGIKSKKIVTRYSVENAMFLLEHKIKALVVGCNSASSLALSKLKTMFYTIPIVDVISAAVEFVSENPSLKRVGVIGTNATIGSNCYTKLLKKENNTIEVFTQACPLFVPLVEEGWAQTETAMGVAEIYLKELNKKNLDALILGCTHYPIIKPIIVKVMGKKVQMIDSATVTAKKLKTILETNGQLSERDRKGEIKYFVSDSPEKFQEVGQLFLGKELKNVRLKKDNM